MVPLHVWVQSDGFMRSAERLTQPVTYHGEGPFWDSRTGRLLLMDVLASTIVAIDSNGALRRYPVPSKAATVIRRRAGMGFVIGTEHGLAVADNELTTFVHLGKVVDDPTVRTNDGAATHWAGSSSEQCLTTQSQLVEPSTVTADPQDTKVLLAPVSISNGVQWSADGQRVYYIDSPTRRVDVFDFDLQTGAWSNRRTHIVIETAGGFPDGMAIDQEGGLWIALWGAGAVNRYDVSGRLIESITVPGVSQVSSCAFGGSDGSILYISTSRQDLPTGHEPDAGAVFAIETSVRGAALAEFAG